MRALASRRASGSAWTSSDVVRAARRNRLRIETEQGKFVYFKDGARIHHLGGLTSLGPFLAVSALSIFILHSS